MRTTVVKQQSPKNSVFKKHSERDKPRHRNPLTKKAVDYKEFDPDRASRSVFSNK